MPPGRRTRSAPPGAEPARADGSDARSSSGHAPDRTCGSCTACCRILAIEALGKPAGVLCKHNTGTACGIYRDRPDACRRWHCLWRKIAALPDALRPDRSGVMFSLERRAPRPDAPEGACIVGRAVGGALALDRRDATEAFAMFVREGSLPVWAVVGRDATRLHPR